MEIEQAINAETKQKDTPVVSEELKQPKQSSHAESTSKKAEIKMAGQSQAAAIQWKMDKRGASWAVLKKGVEGPQVQELQQKLNGWREGQGLPPIKVDGKFGKETEAAVLNYQKEKGLKADGVAGGDVDRFLGVSPHFKLGNKGASIKALQQGLNVIRASAGQPPIKADGIFGKETEDAVRDYQKNMGQKEDGIAGHEFCNTFRVAEIEIRSKQAAHAEEHREADLARAAANQTEAAKAYSEDLAKAADPGRVSNGN